MGHHSLIGPLAAALALSGAPLLLIAAVPQPVPALAAVVPLWGLGTALADATLSSLLFRIVSGRDLAPVVGVTESLKLGLAGAGALAVPVLPRPAWDPRRDRFHRRTAVRLVGPGMARPAPGR